MRDSVRVLHVDDDPDFADLTATFLERADDTLTVKTAAGATEGLERLAVDDVDCVVSDYDMPGSDGIEFLESVAESHPDLPFILFTGKGSEEIASDAISAGVTDYLQKKSGAQQYDLLANRITNAVDRQETERDRRRWKVAIETASEGVAIVAEDGEYRQMNDAYAAAYDESPAEMVGSNWREWYPPAEVARLEERVFPALEREGTWEGEAVGCRADGGEFEQRLSLSILPDGGHVCVIEDITDRKQRQRELRRRNDLFQKAQDIADVGAWEYDARTGELRWTDEVYDIHDLPRDTDVSPDTAIEYYHPDDRAAIREAFTRALEAGEPYDMELRLVTASDSQRWVRTRGDPQSEDGEIVRIRGTVQDITDHEQKKREADLYREMGELLGVGLAVYDDEGRFRHLNPAYAEILGTTVERVTGLHVWDVNDELDAESFDSYWSSFEDGETRVHETTNSLDGTAVPIRAITTQETIHGETYHFGTVEDLTDRKANERELERQNERLAEFASVVGHDLRNPLEVLEWRLELAREECETEHLEPMADALDRSQALIDDLLALARDGETVRDPEPVELAELVESAWGTVQTERARLITETDRRVEADRSRLREFLENLFRNSVDHGGASVTVTVGDFGDGFYVADDGPGIPETEWESVLDSGYTTSENGTGFGLSIGRRVVEAHGWDLRVTESADGGARFEVTGVGPPG